MLEILLIVVLVLLITGGGYGYYRRADWGPAPVSGIWILVAIVLLVLLLR